MVNYLLNHIGMKELIYNLVFLTQLKFMTVPTSLIILMSKESSEDANSETMSSPTSPASIMMNQPPPVVTASQDTL